MRALVTGGAGAIGSWLTRALLARGIAVTILDDLSSGREPAPVPGLDFMRGDVADDDVLRRAFATRFDWVFHLAALFANQNSVDHPEEDLRVNGAGSLRLFRTASEAGVDRLVYASSSCVYGPSDVELLEQSPLRPETPYAATKLLGEHYLSFYRQQHGLRGVSLRLFNVFGPGEYPGPYRNVVPNFIDKARRSRDLVITGTGRETRTFTYVADACQAMLLAAERPWPLGEVYNVASGEEVAIGDLAELIVELTRSDSRIVRVARRPWDAIQRRRARFDRAVDELGYLPATTLRPGLEETVAWHQRHVRL